MSLEKKLALGVAMLAIIGSVFNAQVFAQDNNIFGAVKVNDAITSQQTLPIDMFQQNSYATNQNQNQNQNLQDAMTNLEGAKSQIRAELVQVQSKYNEVDKNYVMVKNERKMLHKQIKAINKKIKSIDSARAKISKNISTLDSIK